MADYSRQIATALRMISAKGRRVAFLTTTSGPANPAQPLSGPAAPATSLDVENVPAVFVQPSSLQALGFGARVTELFAACTEIAILPAFGGKDFTKYKFMKDYDGSTWKIEYAEKLQPAEQPILYFVGVRRP